MDKQSNFEPVHCWMCGDFIRWIINPERFESRSAICKRCEVDPPPEHLRKQHIRINKNEMAWKRKLAYKQAAFHIVTGLLFIAPIFYPWHHTTGTVLTWWGRYAMCILLGASLFKRGFVKSNFLLCLGLLTICFVSPIFSSMMAMLWGLLGGIGLIICGAAMILMDWLSANGKLKDSSDHD